MSITTVSTTELVLIIALVVVAAACIVAFLSYRKRRTVRLRTQFGDAEYDRAVQKGGDQRHAEAKLEERTQRVEAPFVDGPAGAVTEADQLLGDVMSTRGYPVSDFEQRAADISVDHPLVLENYRAAHEVALRQTRGQATTEDLRQAMVHYRTLFEELISEPEMPRAKA